MGMGSAPAAAAEVALMMMCLFFEDVETKTDFPLRGATALESPAVRRLRRSAAVAAAAADEDDVDGDVEAFLWNRLMLCRIPPEMSKKQYALLGRYVGIILDTLLEETW